MMRSCPSHIFSTRFGRKETMKMKSDTNSSLMADIIMDSNTSMAITVKKILLFGRQRGKGLRD
jgi:hypothetical protein